MDSIALFNVKTDELKKHFAFFASLREFFFSTTFIWIKVFRLKKMIKRIRFWLCHYFVLEIEQLLMCFYDVMRSFECWLNLVNRFDGQTKFELLELILSLAKFVCCCLCICVRRVLYAPFLQLLPFACQSKLEITLATKPQCIQIVRLTIAANTKRNATYTDTHNSPRKTTLPQL